MSPNPAPITAIDTRTAAFAGHVPGSAGAPGTIHRLDSWTAFAQVAHLSPHGGRSWNDLAFAVRGYFANGGTRCLVAETGEGHERGLAAALGALAGESVTIVAAPGRTAAADYAALVAHAESLRDRMAILDGPADLTDAHLKVMAGAAGEAPDGWRMPPAATDGFAAFYAPWLAVEDPEGPPGATVRVPPAGHVAGAWAANDDRHGVWKSPAGIPLAGALDAARELTLVEQEAINPRGVNVLRVFPGRGLMVWGARTLSADPEWKYVNVRRLMVMIEGSIAQGTRWAVFEPNDEPLWAEVRQAIEEFLFGLWRAGALPGSKPEQAYFVRCDRSTMAQNDLDNGRVICLVGVAATRPAEFVILRIGWTTARAG